MAALGVVLPMPMSPVPKTSVARPVRSATSMPASTERTASSRVIAGPRAMFCVPGAMRLEMILPAVGQRAQIAGHAHVHDDHARPDDARQGVDARAAVTNCGPSAA